MKLETPKKDRSEDLVFHDKSLRHGGHINGFDIPSDLISNDRYGHLKIQGESDEREAE